MDGGSDWWMDRTKIYITWHHLLPGARLLVVQYSLQLVLLLRLPHAKLLLAMMMQLLLRLEQVLPTSLLVIEQLAKLVAVGTVHSPLTGSVGDSASGCRIHLISTKDLGNELAVPRLTRDLGNELAS